MARFSNNIITLLAVAAVIAGTGWAVRRFHTPGQLDVVTAQAMDMSAMRPPTGAAPVALAAVRRGALNDTVTYTGSILPFNEQDIAPRIVGTITSLTVYPGDTVRAGQVVARLDTSEVSAKATQAAAQARQAQISAQVAQTNQGAHHQARFDQAEAQAGAAAQAVVAAQGEAQAAQDGVADAQAGVQSAQANADYWKTEIVRERQLADAGAASRQEYQSEQSQAQAAAAALAQARSKVRQGQAMVGASQAKVVQAQRELAASRAARRMAQADLVVAAGQAAQQAAGAEAAQAAAREAAVVQGYTRIVSPADGIVSERAIAPGTLVQPGTIILKIAEISRVRVQASVAVDDLAGVGPGTRMDILTQDAPARPIPARVSSVFPAASDQTRTAIVEAVVANPGHRLLPGAFVTVRIAKAGVSDKTLVPAMSVVSEGGDASVWLAKGGAAASAPATYRCEKCHMIYSASDARMDHYRDPMDSGRLLPIAPASGQAAGALTAHRVSVQTGASDGAWTEISGDVPPGSRVVTHGQAGLVEGGALLATAWGANGPQTLPMASPSSQGKTYRCEKCGMTYSAADAQRNHFIDPMDGGKLVPIPPAPSGGMPGMKM